MARDRGRKRDLAVFIVVMLAIGAVVLVLTHKANGTGGVSVGGAGIPATTMPVPVTTSARSTPPITPSTTAPFATTAPATTTTAPVQTGPVGSTFSFESGANYFDPETNPIPYNVRFTGLLDPVHGVNQFNQPSRGHRFVAAVFVITDLTNVETDDAGETVSVIGSNKQSYGAHDWPVSECTDLYNSANVTGQLPVDLGSTSGCMVFELPVRVTVAKVEWSVSGPGAQGDGEWSVWPP